jgi:uncharacterized protein (TIGR00251 family)
LTSEIQALEILRSGDGVAFWVHVTPRARRRRVGGTHGGALRVHVAAPPADGRANEACCRALAEELGVAASAVALEAGARGRRKRVRVSGEIGAVEQRLRALAAGAGSDRNER